MFFSKFLSHLPYFVLSPSLSDHLLEPISAETSLPPSLLAPSCGEPLSAPVDTQKGTLPRASVQRPTPRALASTLHQSPAGQSQQFASSAPRSALAAASPKLGSASLSLRCAVVWRPRIRPWPHLAPPVAPACDRLKAYPAAAVPLLTSSVSSRRCFEPLGKG